MRARAGEAAAAAALKSVQRRHTPLRRLRWAAASTRLCACTSPYTVTPAASFSSAPSPASPPSSAPLLPSQMPHNLYRSPLRTSLDSDDGPLSSHAHIVEPTRSPPSSSLIWLHGLGESPASFRPLFQRVPLSHSRLVVPRAPVLPITGLDEAEHRAWFDLLQPTLGEGTPEDEEGIETMAVKVRELIAEEAARGVPYHRMVLAGVAQGSALATHVALGMGQGQQLGGVVSVSGYVPLRGRYPQRLTEAGKNTAVLVVHGRADRAIEWEWAKKGWEQLEREGVKDIERRVEHGMSHQLTQLHFAQVMDWIKQRLTPPRPSNA